MLSLSKFVVVVDVVVALIKTNQQAEISIVVLVYLRLPVIATASIYLIELQTRVVNLLAGFQGQEKGHEIETGTGGALAAGNRGFVLQVPSWQEKLRAACERQSASSQVGGQAIDQRAFCKFAAV